MSERELQAKEISTAIAKACQLMSRYNASGIESHFRIIDGSEFDIIINQTKKKEPIHDK